MDSQVAILLIQNIASFWVQIFALNVGLYLILKEIINVAYRI